MMTVGLKLLGILGVYLAIVDIGQVVTSWALLVHGSPQTLSVYLWLELSIITLAFTLMLLTRTAWIIDRLGIPSEPAPLSTMDPSQLLRVGLVILGAFSLIEAIPDMGRSVYTVIVSNSGPSSLFRSYIFQPVVSSALKFLLGCIVIGKSERFAQSVFPVSNTELKDYAPQNPPG